MKNIQIDALFGQLEDGYPDEEAYFKCHSENQLMLLEIQSKWLKTASESFVATKIEPNPSTVQGPSMVVTTEG
jgi:ketol-acid reductoisomerase